MAHAAVVNPASGNNSITGTDTWDINNATNVGATDANIVYDNTAAAHSYTVTNSAVAAGGDADIGTIDLSSAQTGAANSFTVSTLDGDGPVTLTVNGAVSGDVAANDLTITVDAHDDGGGDDPIGTLIFKSNVDIGSGTITLDGDAGNIDNAIIRFAGSSEQTVTASDILAADAGDGQLEINNASGVNFAGTIGAGGTVGEIILGSTGDANSTATFKANVTATTIVLGDGANTNTITANVEAQTSDITITGLVDGTAGDTAVLAITDATADTAANSVSFASNVGATADVETINVGSSTQAGKAVFQGTVNQAANAGAVTITGGDNAAEDSSAEFQSNVDVDTFVLNDNTGDATLILNATNGAKTITGTISGASAGEGTLNVKDDDSGESDLITISEAVGGTSLKTINVGSSTEGGDVLFSSTSAATNLNVTAGDAAAENAGAVLVGNGTFTNVTLTASAANANTDATLEFRGTTFSSTAVSLDDAASNGTAEITFNTLNGAQAVSGTIDGAASGEGELIVIDGDAGAAAQAVTFSGNVGATNKLRSIEIGTLAGAADSASAVFEGTAAATTITLTAGNAGLETSLATFNKDVTATNVNLIGGGNGTADATATFKGNLTAATSLDDVTGQSTVVFSGTSAQTITGAITAASDGDGDITVSNTGGVVTFASAIGDSTGNSVNDITLNASTNTVFNAAVDADKITSNGIITFKENANTVDEDLVLANGSTVVIGSAVKNGESVVTLGAQATDLTGNTVTVRMPTNLSNGQSIILVDGAQANAANATYSVTNNGLFTYSVLTDGSGAADNNDVEIVATKRTASSTASTLGITEKAAVALDNAVQATSTDTTIANAFSTALNAGGTEAKKAAEQSQNPASALGATSQVTSSTGAQVFGIASTRLASLRTGAAYASSGQATGFSAGAGELGDTAWVKPFFNLSEQDEKDNIAGYDSRTVGLAAGLDVYKDDNYTVGVSGSYANTNVDGDDLGNSDTDIDSYQLTVYGDYTTDQYYIEGSLGYAYNEVDTKRNVDFGGLSLIANGDYEGNQYMARVAGGMPHEFHKNHFITPTASLAYTRVSYDSYTETGAGSLNLTVDPDDVDILIGTVGARYHSVIQDRDGKFIPELRAGLLYDFIGDEAQSTSQYSGGGSAFAVEGAEVEKFGATAGAGLTFDRGDFSIGANYDAEIRQDFLGHTGTLEARFKF